MRKRLAIAVLALLFLGLAAWRWGAEPVAAAPEPAAPPPAAVLTALKLARERHATAVADRADAATDPAAADAGLPDGGSSWRVRLTGLVEKDGVPSAAIVHVGGATVASTDGTFAWDGVVTTGTLTVWAERGPLRSQTWVEDEDEDPAAWVRLTLVEPSRVVGRVVDADHRAVADAKVTVGSAPDSSSTTDRDGKFLLENVPPGDTDVTAAAAGFATAIRPIDVEAGRENGLELSLERFSRVDGKVVGPSGAPVGGALVRLQGFSTGNGETTSAADGTFTFDRARRPAYVLSAQKDGAISPPVIVRAPSQVTLVLAPAASLTVTVTRAGAPLAGVELWLGPAGAAPPFEPPLVTTARDGTARFDAVATTAWWIFAQPKGGAKRTTKKVDLTPGPNAASVDLPLTPRTVAVHVVDSIEQLGVPAARVTLDGNTTVADGDGHVVFDDVDDGALDASAEATGFALGNTALDEKATTATIALHPRRMLRGRALDEARRPLATVAIAGTEFSTRDGRFEAPFDGTDAPTPISFSSDPGLHATRTVPAGDIDVDLEDVVLTPGGHFALTVTLPDGRPAPWATVYAVTREELPDGWKKRTKPDLTADGAGKLKVPVLPGGYCFLATLGGYVPSDPSSCPYLVKERAVTPVTLRLRQAAWLTGSVKRGGRPASGVAVSALNANVVVGTDEAGNYRLGPLAPGKDVVAVVELNGDSTAMAGTGFTLAEGETQRIDLGGDAGGGVVVRWPEPVAGQRGVILTPGKADAPVLNNSLFQTVASTAVEARFEAVPEGEWTATLKTTDGAARTLHFVVSGTARVELTFPAK